MTPEQLREGWSPRRVGRRIVVLPETSSTNAVALEAVDRPDGLSQPGETSESEVDGLAVLADYQTAGRGRQGRTWSSPRGASVLCSVLLFSKEQRAGRDAGIQADGVDFASSGGRAGPDADGDPQSRVGGWLTLASAVAACEAIRQATELTPAIKWPNDLRVSERKLGGILIESRCVDPGRSAGADTRAWVVGIGINCLQQAGHFPPELRDSTTSLELEASHPIDRVEVARALLRRLDAWLAEAPPPGDHAVHAAWLKYAEPVGQRVRLLCRGREYTGRTVAVDPSGGLIVQNDDNGRREWFDPMLTTLL